MFLANCSQRSARFATVPKRLQKSRLASYPSDPPLTGARPYQSPVLNAVADSTRIPGLKIHIVLAVLRLPRSFGSPGGEYEYGRGTLGSTSSDARIIFTSSRLLCPIHRWYPANYASHLCTSIGRYTALQELILTGKSPVYAAINFQV